MTFVLDWRGLYPTSDALEQKIGERLAWSAKPSFRETAHGWTLAFDPDELVTLAAGHVTHHDDAAGFVSNVRAFLQKLR